MKEKICCICGSGPQGLPWGFDESSTGCKELKRRIKVEIEKAIGEGYTKFITGMDLGVGLYAADVLFYLKIRKKEKIYIEAVVPYKNQPNGWCQEAQQLYSVSCIMADCVTVVSEKYAEDCMRKRDEYMVDKSSLIIAITGGVQGENIQIMRYAAQKNKETRILTCE